MNAQSKVTATPLAKLREPFAPNHISKLPKETRAQIDARKAPDGRKVMAFNCAVCGGHHHKDAVHLDYVGHAALTDRLLDTDIEWSWEPVGFTTEGLPAFDKNGGLWIKLTVAGVSRFGYGSADGKSGGDAVKEIIGDALRNAAMRFGAALDLWHKGDLHAEEPHDPETGEVTTGERDDRPKVTPKEQPGDVSPTALGASLKLLVHNLHGCGDLGELEGLLATEDVLDVIEQCQRRAPHWFETGDGMPAEFKPLKTLIEERRRELAASEDQFNNVRTPIDAG